MNETFDEAERLFSQERYEEAFEKYQALARHGSLDSQVFLGWMYQRGLGVEQDNRKAISCFETAAKLGSPAGQFYMAKACAGNSDLAAARHWYEMAAEKDFSPALFRLGWLYEVGRGVSPDPVKAFSYYEKSSVLGHIFAQRNKALMLVRGHQGPMGRVTGIFLLIKTIVMGSIVGSKDPHSDRVRE